MATAQMVKGLVRTTKSVEKVYAIKLKSISFCEEGFALSNGTRSIGRQDLPECRLGTLPSRVDFPLFSLFTYIESVLACIRKHLESSEDISLLIDVVNILATQG